MVVTFSKRGLVRLVFGGGCVSEERFGRARWRGGVRLPAAAVAAMAFACVLLVVAASIPLLVLDHQFDASNVASAVFAIVFSLVGVVVARHQPRNPIGWLLLAGAFALVEGTAAGAYSLLFFRFADHGLPLVRLAVFGAPSWAVFVVLLPFPILLFPDGRLDSRGARRIFAAGAALAAAFLTVIAVQDFPSLIASHIHIDSSGELRSLDATTGLFGALSAVMLPAYALFCLVVVVRQVLAFRRATGASRQQLKWLMSGGALALIGLIATLTLNAGGAFIAVVALPIGIGVGVLRYRLYEIDRLVSRTLSYALLTALLAGTFIGLVVLSTDALALSGRVAVAASTLVAAALFNPLRVRLQRLVDRRFNRARYNAEATVAAFTARLRDAVEIEAIRGDLLDAVNRAVQPTHASIWIKP